MSIGAQLRIAREAKGLSLGTLAQRTRVQPRALAAIEIDDVSQLPPRPFGRGFVRAYAEEVDLDPEQTVREYFAQFPATIDAPPPPAAPARWQPDPSVAGSSPWTGLGAAVAILLLVVAAAVIFGRRGGAARETDAVGTSGNAPAAPAKSDAPSVPAPASATGEPKPAPATPAQGAPSTTTRLTLTMSVTRPCWVTANADGRRAIYRLLQAGERETIAAEREIAVRFGDAGAVAWTINGRKGDPLGTDGAVRDLRITPENAATAR